MKSRLGSLSPRASAVIAGVALLVYIAAVWFVVVSPKRAEVTSLRSDATAAEARLVAAKATAARPQAAAPVPVADVLQLAKAMPSSADQAGLVLELSALAAKSGVTLRSIAPAEPVEGAGGATMIPVTVTLDGTFVKITRFLQQARRLVGARGDRVTARGRLLTVQSVELVESQAVGFPRLDGTVVLNAYVYDGPLTPTTPEPAPEGSDESTSSAAAGSTS